MRVLWCFALGSCLFLTAAWARSADPEPIAGPNAVRDSAPVTAAIDRELSKRLTQEKVPASPLASDAEFLRRVYVDLTGRIPTAEQAAAFLDSKDPLKRQKLIDQLLASPQYGQHFGIIWSDLIVKRDSNNRFLNATTFRQWLAKSFNEEHGWDQIVRDMLTASGTVEENPAATFFVAHRDMNNLQQSKVVGTTANLFMGLQLQCAECHNHPFIREWKQTDFWGTVAFFSQTRSTGGQMGTQNTPVNIAEGASRGGDRRFGGFGFQRGPTVTGAKIEIPDATDPRRRTGKIVKAKFFQADEPELGDKGPYRPALADWLVSPKNKFFAPAAVNRLWAHLYARGFVNPIDDMQDDNTPSHPELLTLLAEEFRLSGHDQKHLIRCICNSQAYQRTSRPLKDNEQDTQLFSHQAIKIMSPEVLYDSLCSGLSVSELRTSFGGPPGGFGGGRGFGGSSRGSFVSFFSTREDGGDPTEMSFGIPQYLRLMNSQPFNRGSGLVDKLVKEEANPDKALEVLFLNTLSRRPTPAEAAKLKTYIARKEETKDGYTGVLWVLVNSAEFVCVR